MVKIGRLALALGLMLIAVPDAHAQMQWTDKLFVNLNGGSHTAATDDFVSASEFSVYEEPASLTASQKLESGFVFDGSVGYRVWKNLAVGVGLSRFSSESDVVVNARIPHPLFYDQSRVVGVTSPGAKHTQVTTHVQLTWFWPFSDKLDFAFSGGPSFVSVSQELVTGVTIVPEAGPVYANPEISDISVSSEKKTAVGINVGADASYRITKQYGVGVGVRYLAASADLPGLTDSLNVGGFQVLGGLRLRF